jgi:hypothetical protein
VVGELTIITLLEGASVDILLSGKIVGVGGGATSSAKPRLRTVKNSINILSIK